ncbi:MAG TPA: N-acetylmuramoyl-L-alanine amidase [Bacillales bacterium]|nr:N-acetylmuramoyl-L-alanine amidase [Bacillales bacterium]
MGFRKMAVGLLVGFIFFVAAFGGNRMAFAQSKFTDFGKGDWGYGAVHYLVEKGVLKGYPNGSLKPDQPVLRKEAATMVGRALGLQKKKRKSKFPDVKKSSYASGYIQAGVEKGYIHGYRDGTFRPNHSIKRFEMAYLIADAFHLKSVSKLMPYPDVDQDNPSYKVINLVTTAGITEGYKDSTFRPRAQITRREFALMVARAMNSQFRKKTDTQSLISKEVVTASSANVRQGPSRNYHVLGKLHHMDPVRIYKKVNGWGLVVSGNIKGYVRLSKVGQRPQHPLEGKTVVVDAGHGGWDPGAHYYGTDEKLINLQVAKKLSRDLRAKGAKVLMTRTTDKYLSLRQRTNFANRHHADLFISIHENAGGRTSSGLGVYYSSYRPDIDTHGVIVTFDNDYPYQSHPQAAAYPWVREITSKHEFVYRVNGHNTVHKYVGSHCAWAFDNTPSKTAKTSKALASKIKSAFTNTRIGINHRGTFDQDLFVTRHTKMPSILVEMGFMTNPDELRVLKSQSAQARRAQKLANTVEDFYKNR